MYRQRLIRVIGDFLRILSEIEALYSFDDDAPGGGGLAGLRPGSV